MLDSEDLRGVLWVICGYEVGSLGLGGGMCLLSSKLGRGEDGRSAHTVTGDVWMEGLCFCVSQCVCVCLSLSVCVSVCAWVCVCEKNQSMECCNILFILHEMCLDNQLPSPS